MFFAFFFYLMCSLIIQILSINDDGPIIELGKDQLKHISLKDINSKTIYIVSLNNISGTYTYDIQSPYLLDLSYGKSEKINKIPDYFEGHFEKIDFTNGYFYSISLSVNIKEDNKYTFIKINIKDDDINEFNNNNVIIIHLINNYTWKIVCFTFCIFLFEIIVIIYFCCCKRKFLVKFCYFRKKKIQGSYKKLKEIYELNIIDIQSE